MKSLLLFGSTGSIGTQTLELVRSDPSGIRVEGITAASSARALLDQAREFRPRFVALTDEAAGAAIAADLPAGTHLFAGPTALQEIAAAADYAVAVNGIVGAAGLLPSVWVLERGRTLALANKESLVVAGSLLVDLAHEHGADLIPIDSEHAAIHQCLRGERRDRIRHVYLTASGGPFRSTPSGELACVTPEQALRHPNWDMGPRISVGSATMMNKALEVIEVHHLFGVERERIKVVVHPQSIVHSFVEFVDGSIIAQMGPPDMRGPIHYGLHHPDRAPADLQGFDVSLFANLTFEEPDHTRFPALALGFRCVEEGSDAGSVLNAADEVAVEAFLGGAISFPDICRINTQVLDRRPGLDGSVEELLRADSVARGFARNEVAALAATT